MGAVDSRQTKAKKKKKLLDPGERPLIFGFCSLFRVPRNNVDSSCIPGSLRAPLGSPGCPVVLQPHGTRCLAAGLSPSLFFV